MTFQDSHITYTVDYIYLLISLCFVVDLNSAKHKQVILGVQQHSQTYANT